MMAQEIYNKTILLCKFETNKLLENRSALKKSLKFLKGIDNTIPRKAITDETKRLTRQIDEIADLAGRLRGWGSY